MGRAKSRQDSEEGRAGQGRAGLSSERAHQGRASGGQAGTEL